MARPPTPRGFSDTHRFGRVGRIPTPTPFPVGDVNAYVVFPVAGSDALTLVDTGIKSAMSFERMRAAFKAFGCALEQIERILVTHAHEDHYGQALRLRDLSGATVWASEVEAEAMRADWTPRSSRDERTLAWLRRWGVPDPVLAGLARRRVTTEIRDPIEVDGVLQDGDRVELGEFTLEVIATPGHCDGHVVFYERDTRLLFSGDHLLTDISPVPLLHIPRAEDEPRKQSLARFMDSLARVEALEIHATFPAHGDVIWDHRELIEGYRLHHERRKLQMARHLADGPLTPFEIGRVMFPKYYESQVFLVMSEVIGHLDLLVNDGTVRLEEERGMERARLATPAAVAERA